MKKSQIGLIGLGTMGANLARNIADKKFQISVYNRTTEKADQFIKEHGNDFLKGCHDLQEFVDSLESPRKIMILVKAGEPVQMVIDQLLRYLDKGDLLIDCGNSNYQDTQRRFEELEEKKFLYMGCGVSGGEEGALHGPSLMPGGSEKAWKMVKNIFQKIAAKDFNGDPCVTYVGDKSAGHYVKMVHNGIEYGVMQIMAEAYEIFRSIYELPAPEIAEIFKEYNKGKLQSFLFEVAIEVLEKKDDKKDGYLIDKILDKAAQKGTGRWTGINALDQGVGLSTITEAVFARIISSKKQLRTSLSELYPAKSHQRSIPLEEFTPLLENALYAAILSSYAQGYDLIHQTAKEQNWKINLSEISRIWEGGCIIRAQILNTFHQSYKKTNKYQHLFKIPKIVTELQECTPQLRETVSYSIKNSIPIPCLSSALNYFEALTSKKLPANFIQGLRDNFGAHTYQRIDQEGNFHTEW